MFIRVAKTKKGFLVSATRNPNYEPLKNSSNGNYNPTVQFGLNLDIPDNEFDASRILLEAQIRNTNPAVEIHQLPTNEDRKKKL